MFRSAVAIALIAAAHAQIDISTEVVNGDEHLVARSRRTVDLTTFESRISEQIANAQIQAERAAFNATLAATATMNAQLQSLQQSQADTAASLVAQMSQLTASVSNQMAAMNAQMSTQLSTAASAAAAQAEEAAAATEAGISRATAAGEASVTAMSNCNARGQYWNGAECADFSPVLARTAATTCNVAGQIKVHPSSGKIEVCDGQRFKASIASVHVKGFASQQGCENCYPGARDIVFRKHYADTYLRIVWYDNSRVYGWGGRHAIWRLRVCDANGNGCAECNDPGPMMADKYTWAEHNWRVNLHHPTQITAFCRRTTNRQLNPGQYKIRLWLQSGSDAYTGHHNQYGSLQVEEVYKI